MTDSWSQRNWNPNPQIFDSLLSIPNPSGVDDSPSPYQEKIPNWKDLNQLVQHLAVAIEKQQKIMVFGDFDVDGIMTTVLLVHGLRALGGTVSYRIPCRKSQSHGLTLEWIDSIKATGAQVILTGDCGTNDQQPIEYAQSQGLVVLVSDHHTPYPDALATPEALVNPQQDGVKDTPAGVGVAWYVLRALAKERKYEFSAENWEAYLSLVAVGTVADCVPLIGRNRALVREGLLALNKNHWVGLTALNSHGDPWTTEAISFALAPCLNAASRLGNVLVATELFLGSEKTKIYAEKLQQWNRERRAETERMWHSVPPIDPAANCWWILSAEYQPGLIGLLAGQLSEKYQKPAFVGCQLPTGNWKISARAPLGYDLTQALQAGKELLKNFGGHPQAGGAEISAENLDPFHQLLEQYFAQYQAPEACWEIYGSIDPELLTTVAEEKLLGWAPFGVGNPAPIWQLEGGVLREIRPLGKTDQHFKLQVEFSAENSSTAQLYEFLVFSQPKWKAHWTVGKAYDWLVTLQPNYWQGAFRWQWQVMDGRAVVEPLTET